MCPRHLGQSDVVADAREVWNRRAWDGRGWTATEPGDRALADMLRAHDEMFHGGMLNVVECLSEAQIDAAIDGYRYFGLDEAAAALREARRISDDDEERLNEVYWAAVPEDELLYVAFEDRYQQDPTAFAHLEGPWGTGA